MLIFSYLLRENKQNVTTNEITIFFPVQVWLSHSVLYNYCGIYLLLAHPVQEWIYWREKERGGRFGNLWSRKSSLVSCCFRGHMDTRPLQRRPLLFLHSPSMQLLLVQVRTLLGILIDCVLLSVASLACKPSTEYREAGSQIRTGFKKNVFATGRKEFGTERFMWT